MNTKNLINRSIGIFAGLAIAGIAITVTAQYIIDAFAQTVMVSIGSVIFGAGLTFFLIRITTLMDK